MSDYASIVDRARRSYAAVARLEAALERDPINPGLQINLAAAKKQAIQNQSRLLALSERRHVEVCNYRLLPEATSHYGVAQVSSSLLSYQNLFSQIHDAKRNGPKQKAKLNPAALRESSLDFAYSYSGSLGLVLLVQNERDFFSGILDASIEALFEVFSIDTQATVREAIDQLGAAVVKRAHDWSEANLEAGFAADVNWNRSDGRRLGEVIERRRMERLVDVLKQSSDEKTRLIEENGVLIGGNVVSKSFHFVVPNGDSYKGKQADDFHTDLPLTLSNNYKAVIREKKKIVYATEQETITHELVSLCAPTHPEAESGRQ
jgi:hypothetical protein